MEKPCNWHSETRLNANRAMNREEAGHPNMQLAKDILRGRDHANKEEKNSQSHFRPAPCANYGFIDFH
jgi:hypothetical protein